MAFPAGLQTFFAEYKAVDPVGNGKEASAWVFAEIETPIYHVATNTLLSTRIVSKWTTDGVALFELPLPGQPGLTAGYGGATITDFGWRFWSQPTRSRPMTPGSETFVNPHPVAGQVVKVGTLLNIGAWPHAGSVVIIPPPTGGVGGYWVQAGGQPVGVLEWATSGSGGDPVIPPVIPPTTYTGFGTSPFGTSPFGA